MPVSIRSIDTTDNIALAKLIRDTLDEFGIPQVGTVYDDPDTDRLYEVFQSPGSAYFIAEEDGVLLGGCGIFPTPGLPEGCAELVKYYVSTNARGKGLGRTLMEYTFTIAKEMGYAQLYLESFPDFAKAVAIYEKAGFRHLDKSLGNSGHYACTVWMLKDL